MIGMSDANALCTVELLSHKESDNLVWKNERRERPQEVCPSPKYLVYTVRAANDEGDAPS